MVRTELLRRQDYRVVVTAPGDVRVIDVRRNASQYFWGNVAVAAAGIVVGAFSYQYAYSGGGLGALMPIVFVTLPALSFGAVGAATDFLTGAMWKHTPTDVKVNLQPSR